MTIPVELIDAIRQKRVIPFIGAGLSMNLGLPSWSKLIEIVSGELGLDPDIARIHGDFLQIAEYYYLINSGLGTLRSKLDRIFNNDSIDISSSLPHILLPDLKAPAIYTTNWDNLIERAFDYKHVSYNKIVTINDLINSKPDLTNIVKFHGDFSRDETIVFTESSYFKRLDFETALDIKLRSDMLGRVVLFLGYSFSDLNIRYMWYKLIDLFQSVTLRHSDTYAYIVTTKPNPIFDYICHISLNIKVITLDPTDIGGSLVIFLESLIREVT
jgi:hypothetical protein